MQYTHIMMSLPIYQIDAFTNRLFSGNPAAVVPLDTWLPDEQMQAIALENNLSETAFFVPRDEDFELRWFTPAVEVDLCGHATLATAHVLFQHLNYAKPRIVFHTRSGPLTVERSGQGYQMDFPVDDIRQIAFPPGLEQALGSPILEVWQGRNDIMAVLSSQDSVLRLAPDMRALAQLGGRGIIATAPGEEADFVSRCFFPAAGVDEDPVTGSAHTTMTPYWAGRLVPTGASARLEARQLSARGGALRCVLEGKRVLLEGEAVTYLKGEFFLQPSP